MHRADVESDGLDDKRTPSFLQRHLYLVLLACFEVGWF
jgi:hypothetical protein